MSFAGYMAGSGMGIEEASKRYQVSEGFPAALLRSYNWPHYDSETFGSATTATELRYFAKPRGQTMNDTTAKTALHASDFAANQLGSPKKFDLFGFAIKYNRTTTTQGLTEKINFSNTGVFTFKLGENTFLEQPLENIPEGAGVYGFTGDTAVSVGTFGNASHVDYFPFTVQKGPVTMDSVTNFSAIIGFPSGLPAVTATRVLRVYLMGIQHRGL